MKKILNIFASISLITTGTTAVVACGSSTQTNTNDQKIVNDIINKLKDKTFAVNEDNQGDLNFGSYSQQVLNEVTKLLANDEKQLVSFAKSENLTPINAEKTTNINLHVQSHKIYQDIDISVKLNYDAQSIADTISNQKIITVLQTGGYKSSESANKYTEEIKKQINNLLTPTQQQSGYQISGWGDTTIYWPYWDKIAGEKDKNQKFHITIAIGSDIATAKIRLEFKYYQEKKILDDPRSGEKENSLPVHLGSYQTVNPPWDEGIIDELNSEWEARGGLTQSLYSDVDYKELSLKKGISILVGIYFKDGIFDYTEQHPVPFYAKGN